MKAIYGLYTDPELVQRAVDGLRRAGVAERAITVIASQPYEEFEFSHRDKPSWIFWIAAGGGALGLLAGFALAYITQALWPIRTGGMPIVPMFPGMIIMFEMTMLGAILATAVSLLIMTELPTVRSKIYDPEVSQGKIMVAIENPSSESISALKNTFHTTGVDEVKTIA